MSGVGPRLRKWDCVAQGLGIENSEPRTMNQHQEPWNPEQGTTRV